MGTQRAVAQRVDRSLLFDLYGPLLTERQRQVWSLYWHEDWSLGEISEAVGVSRAAVHDTLERAWQLLQWYETRLGMASEHQRRVAALERLAAALGRAPADWPGRTEAWQAWEQLAREEGLEGGGYNV
ncbi:MAG: YlxM family DNA-binding protein [Firmicutes bacterium]|nr:YlxM family DNA-binding protein [Alicyclobacillaceae bacterium]MCL6496367.1 YlxM family DNA-binding protein [Bacillota bacterium]